MTKAMLSDGGFETIIEWGIEIIMSQNCLLSSGQQSLGFSFLLGSRIIDLPMWLPNNEKRFRLISGPFEKVKVLHAGEMGLELLDTTILNVLLWFRKYISNYLFLNKKL